MTIKYPASVCVLAVVLAACAPQTVAPSPSPTPAPTAFPKASPGLPGAVEAQLQLPHRWFTMPDDLIRTVRENLDREVVVTAGGQ